MARKGPAPKPRALKLVQGTLRKDRDNGEVAFEAAAPDCPGFLDAAAKAEWKRMVPILLAAGLLTLADRAALAAYCQAFSRWKRAEEELAKQPLLVTVTEKGTGARAEVWIAANAMKEMRAFLVEFGLSPASRTRVRPTKLGGTTNPFEAI